jgi:protein-S-isoprenylcysteine O-methyltransferase Ste14
MPAIDETPASADVRIAPGLYPLAGLLLGFAVDLWIWSPGSFPRWLSVWGGWLALAAGAGLGVAGSLSLRLAGTAFDPMKPTTRLLTKGVFRWSRNPTYLGLTLAYVGVALLGSSVWSLVLLPVVLALFQRQVIRREEQYLTRLFGATYEAYARRVRRWV